jgi:hypothetical protein
MKLKNAFQAGALRVLLVAIVMTVAFPKTGAAANPEERLATQHFFCNTGYTRDTCLEQIATLKSVVTKGPTEALGEWTWVLVRSQDWKPLMKTVGLHQDSPAFTCLEKRTTFVEEALVAKVSGNRPEELISRWHMGMRELLNLAVEHEMGHALCSTLDEDKANHVVTLLEQNRALSCRARS